MRLYLFQWVLHFYVRLFIGTCRRLFKSRYDCIQYILNKYTPETDLYCIIRFYDAWLYLKLI